MWNNTLVVLCWKWRWDLEWQLTCSTLEIVTDSVMWTSECLKLLYVLFIFESYFGLILCARSSWRLPLPLSRFPHCTRGAILSAKFVVLHTMFPKCHCVTWHVWYGLCYLHPHPRQNEVGVFFARFGKSRISLNEGFLKRPVHQANRQGKFSSVFSEGLSHFVISRKSVKSRNVESRMGTYIDCAHAPFHRPTSHGTCT